MEEEHRDKLRPHIHCYLIFAFVGGAGQGEKARSLVSDASHAQSQIVVS